MTRIVYIDGDQGTTGLRIVQRLRGRQDITLRLLPDDQRKDPLRRAEALNACDVAILCLPDAAAREAVGWIQNPQVRVIDASSATCSVTVGGARCNARAAAAKLPSSATASKVRKRSRLSSRMPFCLQKS